jgi:hypothetical protein
LSREVMACEQPHPALPSSELNKVLTSSTALGLSAR